jgi:hypothetical protein
MDNMLEDDGFELNQEDQGSDADSRDDNNEEEEDEADMQEDEMEMEEDSGGEEADKNGEAEEVEIVKAPTNDEPETVEASHDAPETVEALEDRMQAAASSSSSSSKTANDEIIMSRIASFKLPPQYELLPSDKMKSSVLRKYGVIAVKSGEGCVGDKQPIYFFCLADVTCTTNSSGSKVGLIMNYASHAKCTG